MIHHGDCVQVMAGMEPESVDAVVTDPPYGLEFMGKEWDRLGGAKFRKPTEKDVERGTGRHSWSASTMFAARNTPDAYVAGPRMHAWHQQWAEAAYRVAKPGAYLLAFGGTRTVHRLACAIEDAGWIIRDTLVWAYAQGFPKSKASLKPAWEPIVMARKPGPLRELAIDACRIEPDASSLRVRHNGAGTGDLSQWRTGKRESDTGGDAVGRWPANVILTDPIFDGGIEGVVGGGDAGPAGVAVQRNGGGRGIFTGIKAESEVRKPSPVRPDEADLGQLGASGSTSMPDVGYGDTGTYSRFFVLPKADRADREPVITPAGHDRSKRFSNHPTVKPTELMRHLVRLVTPVGGVVLDPFAGSGSTLLAAELEGFPWIGIEKEAEYVAIAEARLNGTQRGLGLDVPAPTEKRGKMPPHVGPGTTWWDSVKRYGDEPSGEDAA